jgi:hypothetical protein
MDCQQCLEENKRSIAEKGYGYGHIGKEGGCERHQKTNKMIDPYLLKWTDGLPYERSRRMKHQIQMENEEFSKKMETTAYTSSLNHDENTWDILNQSLSGSGFKVSNKREELGDKLANREMVQQIGFNPFLGQTNYVDDISIRDQFLKPVNTSQGEKNLS